MRSVNKMNKTNASRTDYKGHVIWVNYETNQVSIDGKTYDFGHTAFPRMLGFAHDKIDREDVRSIEPL